MEFHSVKNVAMPEGVLFQTKSRIVALIFFEYLQESKELFTGQFHGCLNQGLELRDCIEGDSLVQPWNLVHSSPTKHLHPAVA